MLEQFFNAVYHPNRTVELMHCINLLYRCGMTGHTDRIEHIIKGEQGLEPEVIAGNAEKMMIDGILAAYAQFGVEIEFEPNAISTTADLLEFLLTWDTAEGVSHLDYPEGIDIHELGNSNTDILIELFEMVGKNHDGHLIDWIVSVSPSLIKRLGESMESKPMLSDEESTIPGAALSDFRIFAAIYPESKVVDYVRNGAALGQSMNTLIVNNDKWFEALPVEKMAIEVSGMALMSDLSRETLREEVAKLMEPVLGSSQAGQRLLAEINKILTRVLGHGNA